MDFIHSRRSFIKKMGGTAAALALVPDVFASANAQKSIAPVDKIRIGLIGAGIIGHYDSDTALKVPGVELVAVCDLYTGRLDYAREKWTSGIFTTRDYREILARTDIDAVLICVPDHWHDRISIDALAAGKHVYCEKPMVQQIKDGHAVIEAQRKSGKVFQVGSQRASSALIRETKAYLESGVIGELAYVESINDRWNSIGAWNYSIPTDASPETVDFDRFLGRAPKVAFDPTRFFRWRNYSDYGTGVAGDLFVHLLTGLHVITGALGPTRIFALGDINLWKDGRDVNDLVSAVMDYPKTERYAAFQFITRCNLADGMGGGQYTRFVGTDGVINLGWNDVSVKHFKRPVAPGYGGYDSYTSFSAKQKEDFKKWYEAKYGAGNTSTNLTWEKEASYKIPDGYDDRLEHFTNFFASIREGKPCIEDATFGLRAAGPSIACNMSAAQRKAINWDPVNMKILKK